MDQTSTSGIVCPVDEPPTFCTMTNGCPGIYTCYPTGYRCECFAAGGEPGTCTACGKPGTGTCTDTCTVTGCNTGEEVCSNNCDDNGDGLVDKKRCSDPSGLCSGYQFCSGGGFTKCMGTPEGGLCSPSGGGTCSTSCGQSSELFTCNTDCNPSAACGRETCNGLDDNCSGQIDEGSTCRQDCCPLTDQTNAGAGQACGTTSNNCGGWRAVACSAATTCYQNKCCAPSCKATPPTGKECGTYTQTDGCGSTKSCAYNCGSKANGTGTIVPQNCDSGTGQCCTPGCGFTDACGCSAGQVCTGSYACCTPMTAEEACGIKNCGPAPNGCGGSVSCGECDLRCLNGICRP